jgi:hypothetical protein
MTPVSGWTWRPSTPGSPTGWVSSRSSSLLVVACGQSGRVAIWTSGRHSGAPPPLGSSRGRPRPPARPPYTATSGGGRRSSTIWHHPSRVQSMRRHSTTSSVLVVHRRSGCAAPAAGRTCRWSFPRLTSPRRVGCGVQTSPPVRNWSAAAFLPHPWWCAISGAGHSRTDRRLGTLGRVRPAMRSVW